MNFKFYVGIDVGKLTLDFAVRNQNNLIFHIQTANSKEGLSEFLDRCKTEKIDTKKALFCLEHTGIYSNIMLHYFFNKGFKVWLQSGVDIKKSLGVQRGKNDKIDSLRIAEYAFRFQDKAVLWEPKRVVLEKLKRLMIIRDNLINSKKGFKVLLSENKKFDQNKLNKESEKLLNPVINKLEKQIDKVEKEIQQVITSDENLNRLFNIITSVPGVGMVTANKILIASNEFKDITDPRKFACYSGVAPFPFTSGTSVRGRNKVSHQANKEIKTLLHMASISAVAMEKGELYMYYQKKVGQGKNKMSVLNAVRNKIIHRIFACVKDGRKYENFNTVALV